MRKPFRLFSCLFIFFIVSTCGHPDDPGNSTVSIRLVQEDVENEGDYSIQDIPTYVVKLVISITVHDPETEEDIKTIDEDVYITPEMRSAGFILLQYDVPNGSCSINVEAYDSGEYPVSSGYAHIDITGGHYDVRVLMSQ